MLFSFRARYTGVSCRLTYCRRARANVRKRSATKLAGKRSNSRSERFKQSETHITHTSEAKTTPLSRTSRIVPNFSHSFGVARNSTLFLYPFCSFLSPWHSLLLVLERRAGNSCFIGFVATVYGSFAMVVLCFRRRLHFLRFCLIPRISRSFLLLRGKLEYLFIAVISSGRTV